MNEQQRQEQAVRATLADLRTLADAPVAVTPPSHVAARVDALVASLATPAAAPAPVDELAVARARRGRTGGRRAVLVAVAAALVGVVVLGGALLRGADRTAGTATAARVELGSSGALGTTVLASLGRTDLGALADPAALQGCLRANGVPAGTAVLGSAQVDLDGRPGTLLLLPTGTAGRFTALVVGTACSAQAADTITRQQIGR